MTNFFSPMQFNPKNKALMIMKSLQYILRGGKYQMVRVKVSFPWKKLNSEIHHDSSFLKASSNISGASGPSMGKS